MTLNQTPSAERIHIGIFGKRNAGKSSLINALAGQPVSIVSDFKGTTTDPVKKAMELRDWMIPENSEPCVSKKHNRF